MGHSNILVSGGRGRLGRSIMQLAPDAKIATRYAEKKVLLDPDEIRLGFLGSTPAEKFSGIDTIVNCAGRTSGSPTELYQANVAFPFNLAMSAKKAGVKRFIQASSFSVFGESEKIFRDLNEDAKTEYGKSKLEADNTLISLADKDFIVILLRFPHIFELSKQNKLVRFSKVIKYIRFFPHFSDTHKLQRSMITYNQAAKAMLLSAINNNSGKYIVSNIESFNIIKFIEMIEDYHNISIYRMQLPDIFKNVVRAIFPSIFQSIYKSSFCNLDDIDEIYQNNFINELDIYLKMAIPLI